MLNRETWDQSLPMLTLPRLRCPRCNSGNFVVNESTFHEAETNGSITLGEVSGEIEDYEYRFSVLSVCDNPSCKEPMVISGLTNPHAVPHTHENYIEHENHAGPPVEYVSRYTISYLSSPVKLIEVPTHMDTALKGLLDFAFLSFWSEAHTCANKIRHVLEYLLSDVLKVSKEDSFQVKCGSHHCPKEQKRRELSLGQQIDKFIRETNNQELKKPFKALKEIGNSGSHFTDNAITRSELIKAFTILEFILKEIYKDSSEPDRLSDEIIESRKRK